MRIFGGAQTCTHQHLWQEGSQTLFDGGGRPTTTKIGDDYFLNKLHKAACIKRKSVYYGAKVSGRRSHMQVVICPYCGVLSQNAPSRCSHIRRHLGLTFACRACRKFGSLGKCKEVLTAKAAADFATSQSKTSKEEKA